MDKFLKATGMRKVFMGVYFHAVNGAMLYYKVLPPDNFQVITLVLIAGFFGGNMMENRLGSEKKEGPPAPLAE